MSEVPLTLSRQSSPRKHNSKGTWRRPARSTSSPKCSCSSTSRTSDPIRQWTTSAGSWAAPVMWMPSDCSRITTTPASRTRS